MIHDILLLITVFFKSFVIWNISARDIKVFIFRSMLFMIYISVPIGLITFIFAQDSHWVMGLCFIGIFLFFIGSMKTIDYYFNNKNQFKFLRNKE